MFNIHFTNNADFKFNKIFIIESLNDRPITTTDPFKGHTGLQLERQFFPRMKSLYPDLEVEYVDISDKSDWMSFFSRLEMECKNNGCLPLLHFEIHGAKRPKVDFKVFNSGTPAIALKKENEIITIGEYEEAITKINIACGFNLFISLAVCEGMIPSLRIINAKKPMPFFASVGSKKDLTEYRLVYNFQTFYKKLLETNSLLPAFKALCDTEANNKINNYELNDCYIVFFESWKQYCSKNLTSAQIRKTIFNHCGKIKDRNLISKYEFIYKHRLATVREKAYREFSEIYFQLEKYPENRERFDVPETLEGLLKRKYNFEFTPALDKW